MRAVDALPQMPQRAHASKGSSAAIAAAARPFRMPFLSSPIDTRRCPFCTRAPVSPPASQPNALRCFTCSTAASRPRTPDTVKRACHAATVCATERPPCFCRRLTPPRAAAPHAASRRASHLPAAEMPMLRQVNRRRGSTPCYAFRAAYEGQTAARVFTLPAQPAPQRAPRLSPPAAGNIRLPRTAAALF